MALLPLSTLLQASTEDEVKTSIYGLFADLGLPTTTWLAGAPTRTLTAILAKLFAATESLRVIIAKSGFLDDAEGDWLKLLAVLVYGVTPIEATFASGEVTVDNTGGGVYAFDAGDVVFLNATTGGTYTNSESFTLAALETGKVVAVRALEEGTDSNAAPGQIDAFVTQLVGVTVTNAAALAAVDDESDPDLRQRCRDSLGALSPMGPSGAYEYVAKTPELNGGVIITRVKRLAPPGDGTLTIVVANATGTVAAPAVALVQAGIDEHATPEVVTATVQSATAKALALIVTLYVKAEAGLPNADWQQIVEERLLEYVPTIPIGGIDLGSGGVVSFRALIGQIEELSGDILEARLNPETDVALTATEVATLIEANLTVNVIQVT